MKSSKQVCTVDIKSLREEDLRKIAKSLSEVNKNKEFYKRYQEFKQSGREDKFLRLLSMTYIMHSIANAYAEEAIEMAEEIGIVRKKLKTRIVNLEVAFDLFDKEFYAMTQTESIQKAFCEDYDELKRVLDKYMNSHNTQPLKDLTEE